MKRATNFAHLVERAAGADAIREQHEISIALGIDPERRPGEADVTERGGRHLRAARRGREHRIPPERARASGHRALRRELCDGVWRERTLVIASRGAQNRPRESADAGGGAKETCMAGDAAERGGVVVVHLTGQPTAAP